MKKITCAVLIACSVTACATAPRNPNVWGGNGHYGAYFDGFNKTAEDRSTFDRDAGQCHEITEAENPAGKAVAGAIAGALIGAFIFRQSGLSGNRGATAGAVPGALGGAANGVQTQMVIYRNCMGGRGWRPLN